jgi:hypothetical protein
LKSLRVLKKSKVVKTYEQAFQGLFTAGTSASISGKPKKRSAAKLGLKTIVHRALVCPQPPCRAQTDKE